MKDDNGEHRETDVPEDIVGAVNRAADRVDALIDAVRDHEAIGPRLELVGEPEPESSEFWGVVYGLQWARDRLKAAVNRPGDGGGLDPAEIEGATMEAGGLLFALARALESRASGTSTGNLRGLAHLVRDVAGQVRPLWDNAVKDDAA